MRKFGIILSVLLAVGIALSACGKSTPTKTTPATTNPATTKAATSAPVTTSVATTAPKPTTPKLISWSTLDVGSLGYTMYAQMGESIRDMFGVPVRTIPIGNDVGKLTLVRTGGSDATVQTGAAYQSREGIADYSSRTWGPQKMRMLFMVIGGVAQGPFVKDPKIITVKDLKGKRIPFVIGMASHNVEVEAILAFGGLTWNDVVKVEIPSYAAAGDALIEGKTDMYFGVTDSAAVVKINSSPGGIRFIPLPRSDKEGWQRYNAISPVTFPSKSINGPGLSASNPYEGGIAPQAMDAYDVLNQDTAYFITKAMTESYPLYKDKGGRLAAAELKNVLDIPGIVPYTFHAGSIRYFKDIGRWTPELEAWNTKILDRESKLLKAWDAMLAEADAAKLTEDKIPALWEKYRKEIPAVR